MNLAEAWRAKAREAAEEEARPLLLPSGITVMARRPGPALLASYGRLPLGLATIANGQEAGTGGGEAVEWAVFMYDVLTSCVVSPQISREPGPDRIHPKNLPDVDVSFIFGWAMRGEEAARLATFRAKRSDAAAGKDGAGVSPAAEHAAGDRRSDAGPELRSGGPGSAERTF